MIRAFEAHCQVMDATGLQIRAWYASLRRLARVVGRVDVVDDPRTEELNLDDHLLIPRPNKMRVLCRQREEGTRLQHLAFLFELFTHPFPKLPLITVIVSA